MKEYIRKNQKNLLVCLVLFCSVWVAYATAMVMELKRIEFELNRNYQACKLTNEMSYNSYQSLMLQYQMFVKKVQDKKMMEQYEIIVNSPLNKNKNEYNAMFLKAKKDAFEDHMKCMELESKIYEAENVVLGFKRDSVQATKFSLW